MKKFGDGQQPFHAIIDIPEGDSQELTTVTDQALNSLYGELFNLLANHGINPTATTNADLKQVARSVWSAVTAGTLFVDTGNENVKNLTHIRKDNFLFKNGNSADNGFTIEFLNKMTNTGAVVVNVFDVENNQNHFNAVRLLSSTGSELKAKELPANSMVKAFYDYATNTFNIINIYNASITDSMVLNAENKTLRIAGVTAVESIAELLALTKANGRTAFVKSYYSGKNAGGGLFYYDETKSAVNDGAFVFDGWVRTNYDSVNADFFGAVGDGVTNDSQAIQKALNYCFAKKVNLVFSSRVYAIDTTLIIPQLIDPNFARLYRLKIDGNNCGFLMLKDTALFTSGYDNSGVITSNFGTLVDYRYSMGIELCNFAVYSAVGVLKNYIITLQDWHQNCEVHNISCRMAENFLHSHNSYYCKFANTDASFNEVRAGVRYLFTGSHNLCSLQNAVAVNSVVGYQFDGGITAFKFSECSIEGVDTGILFNSYVYDLSLDSCYFENFKTAVKFDSYFLGVNVTNNYINFLSRADCYFMEYKPIAGCIMNFDCSNFRESMPSPSQLIKNVEHIYGIGIELNLGNDQSANIADMLVDNTKIGKRVDVRKKLIYTGYKANVINDFIAGNYAGRYTEGMGGQYGFKWVNNNNSTLTLQTMIKNSRTQRIYVNIAVSYTENGTAKDAFIAGEFIGNYNSSNFYRFSNTGYTKTSDLAISVLADGFVQINGAFAGIISNAVGEVRII